MIRAKAHSSIPHRTEYAQEILQGRPPPGYEIAWAAPDGARGNIWSDDLISRNRANELVEHCSGGSAESRKYIETPMEHHREYIDLLMARATYFQDQMQRRGGRGNSSLQVLQSGSSARRYICLGNGAYYTGISPNNARSSKKHGLLKKCRHLIKYHISQSSHAQAAKAHLVCTT